MSRKDYILKHDFGYGKFKEKLNKLKLRDCEDVKIYLEDILKTAFNAEFEKETLTFLDDNSKVKIRILHK